jgi:hypothetical protein
MRHCDINCKGEEEIAEEQKKGSTDVMLVVGPLSLPLAKSSDC